MPRSSPSTAPSPPSGRPSPTPSGVDIGDLSAHLYVHYEDRAVAHAFTVACGLDSMAVGEAQVLGQLREALAPPSSAAPPDSR